MSRTYFIPLSELDRLQKVDDLEQALGSAQLTADDLATIRADVATIRAQLSKPTPPASIIAETARSIRTVVEAALGGALAGPLGEAVEAVVQTVSG